MFNLWMKNFSKKKTNEEIETFEELRKTEFWPVWLNSLVFVYELSGCGFESRCSHLNFRFLACFKQGVP